MKAMDLYVTMRFRCNHMITPDAVEEEYDGDLMAFMRWMLADELIWGMAVDDGELVAVEKVHDNEPLPVTAD
jgi:hypothetical protein